MKILSFPLINAETNEVFPIRVFLQMTDENFQEWIQNRYECEDWGTLYNDALDRSIGNWNWDLLDQYEDLYPAETFLEHTELKNYEVLCKWNNSCIFVELK